MSHNKSALILSLLVLMFVQGTVFAQVVTQHPTAGPAINYQTSTWNVPLVDPAEFTVDATYPFWSNNGDISVLQLWQASGVPSDPTFYICQNGQFIYNAMRFSQGTWTRVPSLPGTMSPQGAAAMAAAGISSCSPYQTGYPYFLPNRVAMNSSGVIATTNDPTDDPYGASWAFYRSRAILWDGTTHDLTSMAGITDGSLLTTASAINDSGVVVGYGFHPDGTEFGYQWDGSNLVSLGNNLIPFWIKEDGTIYAAQAVWATAGASHYVSQVFGNVVIRNGVTSPITYSDGSVVFPWYPWNAIPNDAGDFRESANYPTLLYSNGQGIELDGGISLASRPNNFGEVIVATTSGPQSWSLWNYKQAVLYPINSTIFSSSSYCCQQLLDINDNGQLVGSVNGSNGQQLVVLTPQYSGTTSTGSNVSYQSSRVAMTFSQITAPGTTSVTPIDPAAIASVPGGFSVSGVLAYELSTSATFAGSVTVGFMVPSDVSQSDFNNLRILHNVNGSLLDVTAANPAPDFANHVIYAVVNSFSPFYAVLAGNHINALFDQTKAVKGGSTIPIKFQLLDTAGNNMSSAAVPVIARQLKYLSTDTNAEIVDDGNANPDNQFRYDAALGGYVFNLSTKGLASGKYGLSFWVGSNRKFFYTVSFQVK